nr:LuxR family transcriptional regulator [Streptomyces chartreusis]
MDGSTFDLLEREAETASIVEAIQSVLTDHHGALLFIDAPAGIGKTSLLGRVKSVAGEQGMLVASARATSLEQNFAFGVVRQLFEPLLVELGPRNEEELWAGPAAAAREVFAPTGSLAGLGDFAVMQGLFWLAANIGQQRFLAMTIDDIQWCDVPSLRFFTHLLPRLDGIGMLLAVTQRSGEPTADDDLVDRLATDSTARLLRPQPLSKQATGEFLRRRFNDDLVDNFMSACYAATAGNPLLMSEVTRTIKAQGQNPEDASGHMHASVMGPQSVARLVSVRLARYPEASALAKAVAILGSDADLALAAELAYQEVSTAAENLSVLEQLEVLETQQNSQILSFIHPLVQAAFYESVGLAERANMHHRASELLMSRRADVEKVAAHKLRTAPAGDKVALAILESAAEQAMRRGAAQSALTYLDRALQEVQAESQRSRELKRQAGMVGLLVDLPKAADYLLQVLSTSRDPIERAALSEALGDALYLLGRAHQAVPLLEDAINGLGDGHEAVRQRLQSCLIHVTMSDAQLHDVSDRVAQQVRNSPSRPELGGRCLDAIVSLHSALTSTSMRPVVTRALRAVEGDLLITGANGTPAFFDAGYSLVVADRPEAMPFLDQAWADAQQRGGTHLVFVDLLLRSLAWYRRGHLAEAESDAAAAWELRGVIRPAGPFLAHFYADILLDLGRSEQAGEVLDWASTSGLPPTAGHWAWQSAGRGRYLLEQGRHAEALQQLSDAEGLLQPISWCNPAFLSWRSDMALCLSALGQYDDARRYAQEELALARDWGAPWALGRSLRVAGTVADRLTAMPYLEEAVSVLLPSPARLELAKAQLALGAAWRRAGHRQAARPYLRQAADTAELCGAAPLATEARLELSASGEKTERRPPAGLHALTPSERRVAELAAQKLTNRQIAQILHVTPKTVEIHLTSTYRKLEIADRRHLAAAMGTPAPPTVSKG